MNTEDLITIVLLTIGLFLGTILIAVFKQGKLKIERLPLILGIGAAVYMFVSSMTMNIFYYPVSEFTNYTINNLFWSIVFGIVGYIGGRQFMHKFKNKK